MYSCTGNKAILVKGYLPILLIKPIKLKEIFDAVKAAILKTNPDHDLDINILYLYYDVKLVTFGVDRNRNLVIQFPVFIQPCTQQLDNTVSNRDNTISDHRSKQHRHTPTHIYR